MSMSISTSNFFQNLWTSSTEKSEQKSSTGEAGKTQQSAVSASLDQINMGEDGIAITEVSRQQGAEQSQKHSAYPSTDTVEISAEGLAASQQATSSSVEDYETEDLSEYTDAELKQMYYKGEITRQEYEEETGESLE